MQTDPWQLCEYCTGAAVSSTNGAVLGTTDGTAVTHLAAAHVSTAVGLGPWQRNSVESRSSESDKQYLWHQVLKSSYETGLQLRHVAFVAYTFRVLVPDPQLTEHVDQAVYLQRVQQVGPWPDHNTMNNAS
jgi:hypothetical protein